MKMNDFDTQVQSMNRWMNDTEKLVNSLHVGMDPNEVSKRVQEIKVCDLILYPKTSSLMNISDRQLESLLLKKS